MLMMMAETTPPRQRGSHESLSRVYLRAGVAVGQRGGEARLVADPPRAEQRQRGRSLGAGARRVELVEEAARVERASPSRRGRNDDARAMVLLL